VKAVSIRTKKPVLPEKKLSKNKNGDKTKTEKQFLASLVVMSVLIGLILITSGSASTMRVYAATILPTCIDPTGHNLPCVMFISTLPPPKHTILCQETAGQIFKCTFIVDKLSNGNEVVAITVYVPANFVFNSPTVIKVIVHEMTTSSTTGGGGGDGQSLSHKLLVAIGIAKNPIVRGNIQTITVTVADSKKPSMKITGADVNGEVIYVSGHPEPLTGVTSGQGVYSHSWRIGGDAIPGKFKVEVHASIDDKSGSAKTSFTVIPKTNTTTTPLNMTRDNLTVAASGGKGTGSSCINNCTLGTPPPPTVDCKINPKDPSCTQTLQPLTPPTTQTCPDGSVIDASATCPTQSPPSTTSPPPVTGGSQGSPDNNPSPPAPNNPPSDSSGGDNGNPGGGSSSGGSSNGGGSGGGGSNPPSPSTLQ
jgi:uncharacterized membrane protein YgcG